jgi:ferritin-like protein
MTMYILKTTQDEFYTYYYWTIDGEHIFRVQKEPIKKRNGDNNECVKQSFLMLDP